MCGILAVLPGSGGGANAAALVATASEALDSIAHRGPDDSGWLSLDGKGEVISTSALRPEEFSRTRLVFGFRRLAILDLSPAGHQPMRDRSGRYWLAFNGEIYNYKELREELIAKGERFESTSDTEVLLKLLAREGASALNRLDGMFAILFADTQEKMLLVARDPFGIKPLYFWRSRSGGLAFASEIKEFTKLAGWESHADGQRLHDYMLRGVIDHSARTLFSGVEHVPPGCLMELSFAEGMSPGNARLEARRWYNPQSLAGISPKAAAEKLREALSTSVQRQLRADVRVGSCLSGGLDSTSIVALACAALSTEQAQDFRTFTARPDEASDEIPDEWNAVQETLKMTGAQGTSVRLQPLRDWEFLSNLLWQQDEPFASTSILAQAAVFQEAARQGVKVVLDGQGADEQLCGYDVFFRYAIAEKVRQGKLAEAWHDLQAVRAIRPAGLFSQIAQVGNALAPGFAGLLRANSTTALWLDRQALGADGSDPFLQLRPRAHDVHSCSLQQLRHASLPMLLHWEDRNSMSVSVEARVPFVSPAVVELSLALETESKINGDRTKIALRDAMQSLIPESIRTNRKKVAFAAPEREWLVNPSPAIAEMIDRAMSFTSPMLTPAGREAMNAMRQGKRPYDRLLWRCICAGVWIERFGVSL